MSVFAVKCVRGDEIETVAVCKTRERAELNARLYGQHEEIKTWVEETDACPWCGSPIFTLRADDDDLELYYCSDCPP
jgi:hypothetical protein